jgi:hypothetical protein
MQSMLQGGTVSKLTFLRPSVAFPMRSFGSMSATGGQLPSRRCLKSGEAVALLPVLPYPALPDFRRERHRCTATRSAYAVNFL